MPQKSTTNQAKVGQKVNSIADDQQELKKILRETIESNQLVLKKLNWVYRWVIWQQVWSTLKILAILIVIALGVIYLPPAIKDFVEPLQGVINIGQQFR
ncbi:MAG: hypothetical protein JW816_01080 [Candidatus Buchananbacteria bacterium]|nr:hypothetical protein [Candidatus Buchananbacteria bacterium]